MYVSQERFDIQFAAKSSRANLKSPNKTDLTIKEVKAQHNMSDLNALLHMFGL